MFKYCLIASIIITLNVVNSNQNLKVISGRVIEVKSNYYIIKSNSQKLLLSTKHNLNFDDQISVKGKITQIESPDTKYAFNFEKYLKYQNITQEIKSEEVQIITPAKSLRSKLYQAIKNHPNQVYLQKIIFNINNNEELADIGDFLLSSGMMTRSLIYLVIMIVNKFYLEKQVLIIEIITCLILAVIFKYTDFMFYLIAHKLINQTNLERLDKLCLSASLTLVIFPSFMFSLTFIITTLYRFGNFIQVSKNRLILNAVIIIPVQLLTSYQFNFIDIILFPIKRTVNLIAYILAYIDIIFKSNLSYNLIKLLSFETTKFTFSGKLSLLLLLLWIYVGLKLLQEIKISKLALLFTILLVNQNQLLFSPLLTYTQLYINQGDAAVITYPFSRKIMMIDTGSNYQKSKLDSFLNYYGIKEIDKLVISHFDEDHAGNVEYLENNYRINEVISTIQNFRFNRLHVYTVNYPSEDDNDASLITYFKVNDITYLSLGDVSSNVEAKFIKDFPEVKPSVVKLSHHGSKTGTTKELLSQENLILLLNSSGKNNMYNHPHPTVIKLIDEYKKPLIDTQNVGDITIKHFGKYNWLSY